MAQSRGRSRCVRHGRLCSAVEAVFQKVGREPASAGHGSWASSRNLVPPAPSPPLPTSSGPAGVGCSHFCEHDLETPGGDSTLSGAKATQGRASGTRNNDPHCEIPIRRPWFRGREGTRPGRPQGPRSAAEACLSSSLVACAAEGGYTEEPEVRGEGGGAGSRGGGRGESYSLTASWLSHCGRPHPVARTGRTGARWWLCSHTGKRVCGGQTQTGRRSRLPKAAETLKAVIVGGGGVVLRG